MTEPILTVRNLEAFYGPVLALRGISLDVPTGKIVAVLGANGAGKTSLLRSIAGALEPQKGTVSFEGTTIQGLPPDRVARAGIAHVPEGREVFPLLSVEDNLRLGAFARRGPGKRQSVTADQEAVYDTFPILRERRAQDAGTLSGGQQQMLAIGRALMARPRLVLLDEPSLGLAPRLVGEIFETLQRLNEERGLTFLLVEQNAHKALELASHGYVLEVGRVVLEGSRERLLANDEIREFYLGMKEGGVRGQRRWKRRKTWR